MEKRLLIANLRFLFAFYRNPFTCDCLYLNLSAISQYIHARAPSIMRRSAILLLLNVILTYPIAVLGEELVETKSLDKTPVESEMRVSNSSEGNEATVPSENEEETKEQNENSMFQGIFKRRQAIGRKYLNAAQALDNFFSGRRIENSIDDSFLKLELGSTIFDDGGTEDQSRLKIRLDLPKSEKRLRLFFDSDLAEEEGIERNARSISSGNQISDNNSTAGIEIRSKKDRSFYLKPSVSVGARFRSGVRSFVRFRVKNRDTYFGDWKFGIRQDIWHLGGQGFGATNRIEFKTNFNEDVSFASISDTDYRRDIDEWVFVQRWIVSHRQSPTFSVDYKLGHIAESTDVHHFDRHFFNFSLLKNLYDDWLFVTFTPEVAYEFDEKWEEEFSLTLKFDIFFTD